MAKNALCFCCCCCLATAAFVGVPMVAVWSCFAPFWASVDEASLGRLDLTIPGNGTPASLTYNLTLVVALRSRSWAMGTRRAAPLDAELRFFGRPLARARLAGAGEWEVVREPREKVYRLAWKSESAGSALGPDEVAELAAESAAGVFKLDLVVSGKFESRLCFRWCNIMVSCPLTLSVSNATAPAPFAWVACGSPRPRTRRC